MENYPYAPSYPESGDSSPRSREIEFENPPPWENQSGDGNYKVKFMYSYGGKIQPRPHDNQLSYVGGETKIISVERNVKFSGIVAKLSAACEGDVSFKYQLPGEDLDALISVTNDDDLEHMMHEFDRLSRASSKPARLRLFLFPVAAVLTPAQSFGSNEGRLDREKFVEALNCAPAVQAVSTPPGSADFLFGSEKGAPPPPAAARIVDPVAQEANVAVPGGFDADERAIAADRIQKHIQDLQRLRIGEEQQAAAAAGMYRRKSDDNLAGDYYNQKMPEKVAQPTIPATAQVPAGYWPEKQLGAYPGTTLDQQPVYMIPAGANVYHAPMARPVTGPISQGYYAVQRMPEVYREQQIYQQAAAPPPMQAHQLAPKMAPGYPEGMRMVQPTTSGGGMTDGGYAQVAAYDNGAGRTVYYTPPAAVMAAPPQQPPPPQGQYQVMAGTAPTYNQEGGKVVPVKISQTSV